MDQWIETDGRLKAAGCTAVISTAAGARRGGAHRRVEASGPCRPVMARRGPRGWGRRIVRKKSGETANRIWPFYTRRFPSGLEPEVERKLKLSRHVRILQVL
jgi:hypothetical protein